MKINFYRTIFIAFLLTLTMSAWKARAFTISFVTLGNCAICEIRIENAVTALQGINTVHWDMLTDVTTVDYDENISDAYVIMHAIANVGHDTEWFPAPDSAYNLLIGSCCEYERTIDYTQVQVGYLSLMGIWVSPLSITEKPVYDLRVYPTAGPGMFHFNLAGEQLQDHMTMKIYAMNGKKVREQEFNCGFTNSLDLGNLPDSQYLAILYDKNRVIARTKLIKVR